jgi:hypothetical protein
MGRRMCWKTIIVRDGNELGMLRSIAQNTGYRDNWVVDWSRGEFETNIPWSVLRSWFRICVIPWSHVQIVTSERPSWEEVSDEA